MAEVLDRRKSLQGGHLHPPEEILLPHHVPLSLRHHARRPWPQLHHRRCRYPLQNGTRLPCPLPHGLGCLRASRRERRQTARRPPQGMDLLQHQADEAPAPVLGHRLRLGPRNRHLPPRLLQVDPVGLPQAPRAWPGLPEKRAGQLVRLLHHPRQRGSGRRWHLRTLWPQGGQEGPDPVVLQDHRVCRQTPRRSRPAR